MPSKVLELEQMHLTSVSDKLRLSITSSANFKIPSGLSQLNQEDTVKALTSGNLWAYRGASCRLDIHIHIDGKMLEENRRVHVLESLGYRLRDAHLWSQLSLSPSLEIPQPDGLPSKADLSIVLGHGKPPPNSATDPRAWLSSNIDIKAPESVPSAELRRLHITFDFHTTPKKQRPRAKRTKTEVKAHDAADTNLLDVSSAGVEDRFHKVEERPPSAKRMKIKPKPKPKPKTKTKRDSTAKPALLDDSSVVINDSHLTDLEGVRGNISRGLSNSVASRFDYMQIPDADQKRFPQPSKALEEFGAASKPPSNTQSDGNSLGHTLISHFPEAKIPSQVRKRDGTSSNDILLDTQSDEDMLLLPNGNPALPTDSELYDSEMLFSQTTESTISVMSPPSTISTASAASSVFSLKRSLLSDAGISIQAEPLSGLNISPACKLTEVAIRILIGGYDPRRSRGLLGVRVDKPPPKTPLSDLAPGVFSPAFKEPMSHNARYLPTISRTTSSSWPRNVQSPILRQKLIRLANSPSSALEQNDEEAVEEVTTDRLASVVEARLWSMMQQKLYDPIAARLLFNPRSSDKVTAEPDMVEEEIDLLDELRDNSTPLVRESMMEDLENFIKEEFRDEDEFEDLLGGSSNEEDDLLGYLDAWERERLEVEQETDEMLFGNSGIIEDYWEHGDEMLLLEPGSEDESMLL